MEVVPTGTVSTCRDDGGFHISSYPGFELQGGQGAFHLLFYPLACSAKQLYEGQNAK